MTIGIMLISSVSSGIVLAITTKQHTQIRAIDDKISRDTCIKFYVGLEAHKHT
ncbi:MAG: hypothetical protein WAZ77_17180 [Candidatus Nitrosopolaris sp.]